MTLQTQNNQPVGQHVQGKLTFSMPNPAEMQHLIEFCKLMATCEFYKKLGPGGVMAIYLTCKERNLPFMSCLNGGIHAFDGKITFAAILIDALILNAGHKTEILHIDNKSCKIRFTRGDRKHDKNYKPLEYEYTIEDAKTAGYLSKKNWQTSPKDMLWARCLTGGGRKHISEVFIGILVAGELVDTESDSNVEVSAPDNVRLDEPSGQYVPPAPPIPPAIEHKPIEGYGEFVSKHGLLKNSDGTMSKKMEYVTITSEKAKMTEIQVINAAIKNEKLFEERFDLWQTKKYPKPKSMDELAMELE